MATELAMKRGDKPNSDGHAEDLLAGVDFRVDVAREHDTMRVSPVGELDMATVGGVREHLHEAMATGTGRVILDLRATTFLDSTALHLTVETYDWAARYGAEFAIIAGSPTVQRTFEVAGLIKRLPFVDVPHG